MRRRRRISKIVILANFRKILIFGLSVIIDGCLYVRVLGFSSMDFMFHSHIQLHRLKMCVGVLFLKNLNNCNFGEFSKNGNFWT